MSEDGEGWPAPVALRPGASGPFLFVCDHASNHVPEALARLGLPPAELQRHIAWDPGALSVSEALSLALDSPVVHPRVSRLVIDCNRAADAPDLIPTVSERTTIPGNADLSAAERERRVRGVQAPFHAAIEALLDARDARGLRTAVVGVHSFTPVYKDVARPWHVGVLSDRDRRLADALIALLAREDGLVVGDNQPYAPSDGVYYTLDRHGQARGHPSVMLEIRNDLVADTAGVARWADILGRLLPRALATAMRDAGS